MKRNITWNWHGSEVTLGMSEAGSGPPVLLLPALSSISTRKEMHPLFEALARNFHVTSVDWPGFGDRPRPRRDWSPDALSTFLDWFIARTGPPLALIAAGHAAVYALHQCTLRPGTVSRLVLVAPTWRGPLPTMAGGQRPWFRHIRAAIDNPVLGPVLYKLNVSRFVIDRMAREHVYGDPHWLEGARLAAKLAVTRAAGARHGSVRFVTGGLDRVDSREAFLDLARRTGVPILVVIGGRTPPRSLAEMEALASLPGVEVERVAGGRLAVHEEFPTAMAGRIAGFLQAG
ncbi:hypothetical protein LMIY3S_05514 [Labrys miyagiensis]